MSATQPTRTWNVWHIIAIDKHAAHLFFVQRRSDQVEDMIMLVINAWPQMRDLLRQNNIYQP
jgi:hypothetical protein